MLGFGGARFLKSSASRSSEASSGNQTRSRSGQRGRVAQRQVGATDRPGEQRNIDLCRFRPGDRWIGGSRVRGDPCLSRGSRRLRQRETRVAILEDDRLVELLVDRPDHRRTVGDIYLGRVEAVLPGIVVLDRVHRYGGGMAAVAVTFGLYVRDLTSIALSPTTLAVGALVVMNTTIVVVAAGRALLSTPPGWLTDGLFADLDRGGLDYVSPAFETVRQANKQITMPAVSPDGTELYFVRDDTSMLTDTAVEHRVRAQIDSLVGNMAFRPGGTPLTPEHRELLRGLVRGDSVPEEVMEALSRLAPPRPARPPEARCAAAPASCRTPSLPQRTTRAGCPRRAPLPGRVIRAAPPRTQAPRPTGRGSSTMCSGATKASL